MHTENRPSLDLHLRDRFYKNNPVKDPFAGQPPRTLPVRFSADNTPPRDTFAKESQATEPQATTQAEKEEDGLKKSGDFFRQIGLMGKVDGKLRQRIYDDLRSRHMGFWRGNFENIGRGIAKMVNGVVSKLPLSLTNSVRRIAGTPEVEIEKANTRVQANMAAREAAIVAPFSKVSNPATLEHLIPQHPFLQEMDFALKTFGFNGRITVDGVSALLDKIEQAPDSFASPEHLKAAKTLTASFTHMSQLSEKEDTLDSAALEKFKQMSKDSIPFLYERFGQDPKKYVEATLYYLGAAAAFPELSPFQKTTTSLVEKLNTYPSYRRIARWAQDNQASDVQFLPWFSFIDALYGQLVALTTGFVKQFSMNRVFAQMVNLDGLFNGIGFFIAKFQILLVGWEKEKPDRQRAQYEKELKLIERENNRLQETLRLEQDKLAERIKAEPARQEALEKEFHDTVEKKIKEETATLLKRMETFQLKLDKLLGVKKMGFFEKAWKKPPQYLNDLKYMIPIGLVLGIPYEYMYFNFYTDIELPLLSTKFLYFTMYGTALSAVGNVIVKQIIHLTQDRAMLYLHGKKDEMMSQNTREFLANFKGAIDELQKSPNPQMKALGDRLQQKYQDLAIPLIGDENQQNTTEKSLYRDAKLDYSMNTTDSLNEKLKTFDERVMQKGLGKQERKAMANFRKYMKKLIKIHERLAYIPAHRTKFDLELLKNIYEKEFQAFGLSKHLPQDLQDFFKDTLAQTTAYLTDLEKKYPRAEILHEPLALKTDKNREDLSKNFIQGMTACDALLGELETEAETRSRKLIRHRIGLSMFNALPAGEAEKLKEEKKSIEGVMKTLRKVRKGYKKNLWILNAKPKDVADRELQEYRDLRKAYADETAAMPLGMAKIGRKFTQAKMAMNQGVKKAVHMDRYNSWFSGYPWIPAHSLLNVAGRFGLASIVLEQILPAEVLFKIWLTNHIPIRIWAFMSEKFLVLRDMNHRRHGEVTRAMDKGMENYIQNLLKEHEQQQAKLAKINADLNIKPDVEKGVA